MRLADERVWLWHTPLFSISIFPGKLFACPSMSISIFHAVTNPYEDDSRLVCHKISCIFPRYAAIQVSFMSGKIMSNYLPKVKATPQPSILYSTKPESVQFPIKNLDDRFLPQSLFSWSTVQHWALRQWWGWSVSRPSRPFNSWHNSLEPARSLH